MIENYEDLNVAETLEQVEELDEAETEQFIEYESNHKNRTTVIRPLQEQLGLADTDPETVTVTPRRGNYAGGLWFDNQTDHQTVERTVRIDQAIEAGELEVVDQ